MKILLAADKEERNIWDHWDRVGRGRLEGVRLILSAGDVRPEYLEFLVTMLNVPCLYIRGNHDSIYGSRPPEGCLDIDGKIAELTADPDTGAIISGSVRSISGCGSYRQDTEAIVSGSVRPVSGPETARAYAGPKVIRIAGLGGSMRYHGGPDMYTEREMSGRVRKLIRRARMGLVIDQAGRVHFSPGLARAMRLCGAGEPPAAYRDHAGDTGASEEAPACIDIFLTHTPCLGHGDLDDLPHRGFACFNKFNEEVRPAYHCYGHVHQEYDPLMKRESRHPSGTRLINVSGIYILDV